MIRELHLEITRRCLLQCPKCPRTYTTSYKIDDLSYSNFKELVKTLQPKALNFCGNLGDPIFHKELDKFVKFGFEQGCDFYMSTAGVGKNMKWWESFYNSYSNDKGQILFGLDGLEDTAHKYRVGTDWHNVFDAMKLGASMNKNVIWQWIPFSFNEHQIEEAKELAKEHNIKFMLRLSSRFDGPDDPMRPTIKEYQLGYNS